MRFLKIYRFRLIIAHEHTAWDYSSYGSMPFLQYFDAVDSVNVKGFGILHQLSPSVVTVKGRVRSFVIAGRGSAYYGPQR